ncbi:hypothetical protein A3F29_03530 [Candidatus Roizmanbacteria bacterium RIFCSPHIGHO2_12_FULL_33_9]|uniref:Uncharacterized protein n=1 Tax=Candidatus Roizmanbacteria bacterium RIFCSPHIGHO2_12_FULL_33_9 TaxID=1802045 RepID=A0A1F7HI55_9BACT|nr:MAG: hypothetical protein A3F29_03530 [Candidatus Roizmanbacteria bacterium RIFCSPHIGHO2_12_FULL_33_9]
MGIIKRIIFSILILIFPLLFISNIAFGVGGLEEDLNNKLGASLGCGYPNTDYKQCCLRSTVFNITKEDSDIVIEKLKSCTVSSDEDLNKCLTNQEAEIILTLINVSESELVREATNKAIAIYVQINDEEKDKAFAQIEQILRRNAEDYINMPRNEKLKVTLRNSIPREKCFISGGPIKGFCTTKIAGYFADQFGNDPNNKAILEAEDDLTIDPCVYGGPIEGSDGSCTCTADTGLSVLCGDYISDQQEYNKCVQCTESRGGFWTGFGCIGLSFQGFVQETLFGWALGLAGTITLLCIIYAAFMLQTSAGNPERIKKARQYLTACITGLLLIIFSILILRIIGINILQIPGFN